MKLTVNGEPCEHAGRGTIAELLRELGAEPERVAIVVNDEIVRSGARAAVTLKEGDRIEIIAFAGGG